MTVLRAIILFIIAALFEIGGGYLIWLWVKEGRSMWLGILGGLILATYGVIAALQLSNFARVYAAYGGIFIVLSILWAYKMEDYIPDKFDIIGAVVVLIGASIIYFAPRG